MSTVQDKPLDSRAAWIIGILAVVVPALVAVLLFMPQKGILGLNVSALPHINAALNSATALLLIVSLWAIKNGRIAMHKRANISAFVLSSLFLVSYVIYHTEAESTMFGDVNGDKVVDDLERGAVGVMRIFYLILLLAHIAFATIIVPFVLLSMYLGLTNNIARHRRISKITWPMWFFVAVSGVLVYAMISPYYQH